MEKEHIRIAGKNIAVYDTKEGDEFAIVLHGWGANVESVMPIVNCLKDKFRVIAYDSYGHGGSDEPDSVIGGAEYAALLEAIFAHYGIARAHCIGHSFGGKTLTEFAATRPERVDKLVLIDASGVLPKRKASYYYKVYSFKLLRFLYEKLFFWQDRETVLEKFYRKFGSDDYQAAQGIMRKVFVKVVNESTESFFPAISAPTLLIWGEDDDATPLYMARVFEEKIPEAGLAVLPGGHYSYLDAYGQFCAVLDAFFKE
ncbi:2-hydroxy-6-oxononadienedioate/2-hydroxy-6-oxononatrienedioate hydrolase [Aedoeadaptatus ivorii]|uniref:2-hydroxy-6-oxononadienedioate/2-hydroxy-6-oxonon atrienedioate hydrolase n=1 Tax=Aedoeadaptatus ivorii TaxID=54006 RepID=A0A3S5AK06_9FIRM|nr:alpha/beta hydrolase [Peptoniphilus ivorii]VEJ36068.1 2-hydroxy-6-oxononadienedioate/2-hydroxy-6-oxononatrienedioate hydrolase [Peptoniphilus ivorii]